MSEKRKDTKGRILKTGEAQRPNGTYMYRYTDTLGEKHWCYAPTLRELREKEQAIQQDLRDGINPRGGSLTVISLVEKYILQKKGVRENTRRLYSFVSGILRQQEFSKTRVVNVKPSDARIFLVHLHDDEGYSHSSISTIRGVLRPAFEMAVEDNIIRRNPFQFPLSSVIKCDATEKMALSSQQENELLSFVLEDKTSSKYYDEIVILLETGMRVSEMYGLTVSDVDLVEQCVRVERQIQQRVGGQYYVERPKSKNGERTVPLSDKACEAFARVISRRTPSELEMTVDGYKGFLFSSNVNKPKTAKHLDCALTFILKRYNKTHKESLPKITPHTFRHTFITNMYIRGLDVKSLQEIVGHGDVRTTLTTYMHQDFERTKSAFRKLVAN